MSHRRILLVSWEYPPVLYGGLGRHVHALAEALADAGHDVVVVSQRGSDASVADEAPRPRVVRAVLPENFPDVYLDTAGFVRGLQPRLVAAADDALGGWTPDVVHGHDWVVAGAATALAQAWQCPLVMTMHATEAGLYDGHVVSDFSRWRHAVERDVVGRAEATIVCSTAMRTEVLERLGGAGDRVVVVSNGVHPRRWTTSRAQRAAARDSLGVAAVPVLALVGRLEHEKGAQDAIAAVATLGDREPAPHLLLVGDGSRSDDLRRQAADLGVVARVHLLGRRADPEVAAFLGAADVALVPSRYEPFGLVALEAMAAGTPLVVSATGGLVDVVEDGISGLVVPPADPAALARAIARLLDDDDLRRRLSETAAARVGAHFSWDAVAAATGAVYDAVLD